LDADKCLQSEANRFRIDQSRVSRDNVVGFEALYPTQASRCRQTNLVRDLAIGRSTIALQFGEQA
jgi:hypothetical protein